MTKQARRSVRHFGTVAAGASAAAALAAVAMALPLAGTASAATYDRHASMQTKIIVKATSGHLAQARRDVAIAGGRIISGRPVVNGFNAQVPVKAVASIRHAPGVASVVIVGQVIVN